MTARKFSTSDVQAVLQAAFSLPKPPSDGTLSNIIDRGSQLAEHILDSATYHYPLGALEFDELFHANSPILAALEPQSMALLFLEQLGNCKASSWKFAFDYRAIAPPNLMVHDCSSQGNLLVRTFGRDSQLCIFHKIRQIKRELTDELEKLYKKALQEESEELWMRLEGVEAHLARFSQVTHLLDFNTRTVRRFEDAQEELLIWCQELRERLALLGLTCKAIGGLELRAQQFVAHIKRWEDLAEKVEYKESSGLQDGFLLLDALAECHLLGQWLENSGEQLQKEGLYWQAQESFLESCRALRELQTRVVNNGEIIEKFSAFTKDLVRTSSRIEALNRRLRGFTDAKRNVTERQLRLMHLHHNTTPFSKDAKRAGKSPWQILGLEVDGLADGFLGVLQAANQGQPWPSPWTFKS